jgi:hypothetical protein
MEDARAVSGGLLQPRWVGVAVLATMGLGLALRIDLATGHITELGIGFADLRHAHSHLGFYGFLTLAWWLVLTRQGHATGGSARPGFTIDRRFVLAHGLVVVVASALFAVMGYTAPTIALSTLVAASWGWIAWRTRKGPGWLALAPWGVFVGLLLVPAIAVMAKRDFTLSRQLAHVFIALILLWTFVPMALSLLRVPRVRPWAWMSTTLVGSTYLVFADRWPWPLGAMTTLAGLALGLSLARVGAAWPWWLRGAWWALAGGMVVLGIIPPLQVEATRVAALHFTVLGPIALTLLWVWSPPGLTPIRGGPRACASSRRWALYVGLAALATMLAAMIATEPLRVLDYGRAMQLAMGAGVVLVLAALALLVPFTRSRPSRGGG